MNVNVSVLFIAELIALALVVGFLIGYVFGRDSR